MTIPDLGPVFLNYFVTFWLIFDAAPEFFTLTGAELNECCHSREAPSFKIVYECC